MARRNTEATVCACSTRRTPSCSSSVTELSKKKKFRSACKQILARGDYDTLVIDIYLPSTVLGYLFPCFASAATHLGKLVAVAKIKPKAGDKKHS